MARLPFNPDRVPAPPPPERGRRKGTARARPLTVSEVAACIKGVLADGFPTPIRVIGEVSNLTQRTHWFFSLKDEGATLRAVCFATNARSIGFDLKDGMQVVASGRIDYYDAQGHLQLYVDRMEPVGMGALELRLRALCEELRRLGYFDPERKKPLPVFPRTIAVVTSRTGAAWQDVISTTRKRWAGCRLLLLDVHVQGAAAAPEIAAAIRALARDGPGLGVDAIILTRGGGSIEDLWAFNEREVADAIFQCTIPVVAAIGHETDITVAELVADRRCATPTQAAMTLVPAAAALEEQVLQRAQRLTLLAHRRVMQERQRLEAAAQRPIFRRPRALYQPIRERLERGAAELAAALPRKLRAATERLDLLAPRVQAAGGRLLKLAQARLEGSTKRLESIGPMNVLRRGYSYALLPDGRVVRSVTDAHSEDRLATVLIDGRIHSRVEPAAGAAESREEKVERRAEKEVSRADPSTLTSLRSPLSRRRKPPRGPGLFG